MSGIHHRMLRRGFSMMTRMKLSRPQARISAARFARRLVLSTRAASALAREGKPCGSSSERSGLGAGAPWARRACGTGISRALLKVPQGTAIRIKAMKTP
eukprot:14254135-Heterocapsa_arctica.AAC.1